MFEVYDASLLGSKRTTSARPHTDATSLFLECMELAR